MLGPCRAPFLQKPLIGVPMLGSQPVQRLPLRCHVDFSYALATAIRSFGQANRKLHKPIHTRPNLLRQELEPSVIRVSVDMAGTAVSEVQLPTLSVMSALLAPGAGHRRSWCWTTCQEASNRSATIFRREHLGFDVMEHAPNLQHSVSPSCIRPHISTGRPMPILL